MSVQITRRLKPEEEEVLRKLSTTAIRHFLQENQKSFAKAPSDLRVR